MSSGEFYNLTAGAALCIAYIALFHLSDFLIQDQEAVGGIASLLFLPAFVRLLGYLLIGYWVIPALFVAALFCVDLGLDTGGRVFISAFIAVGGPIGAAAASLLCQLKPTLNNLTAIRLLVLSFGCAAGNSILYDCGLMIIGHQSAGADAKIAIFLGDLVGMWVMVYLIKLALEFIKISPRS